LAIAFALAAAIDVAKDLHHAHPHQKLIDYKNDLRGPDMAPRRFFLPYDSSPFPRSTTQSPGATEPMKPFRSVEDTPAVQKAFGGFPSRGLSQQFLQDTNQNHTGVNDKDVPSKSLNASHLPDAAQIAHPDEEELALEEAGGTIRKSEENSPPIPKAIIEYGTDYQESATEPLDEGPKAGAEVEGGVVTADRRDGFRRAQHGNVTYENKTHGPTNVPQNDSQQITSRATPRDSATSPEEQLISKSEPSQDIIKPESPKTEESSTPSILTFGVHGSEILGTTLTVSKIIFKP